MDAMTGTCSMPDTKTAVPTRPMPDAVAGERLGFDGKRLDMGIEQVQAAPAPAGFVGENPRPAKMFLESSIERVFCGASREGHWGWDGASLETVSAIAHDPVQADINLYRYVANNPLINTDPLGLKKETVCCTQWTRRFVTLGYAYDQVGAMECILDQLGANPVYKAAITAAVAAGTTTAGGILKLLKINYAGTLGPMAALALEAKFLNDFVNAANYCRAYVCTQTVPKVEVTYTRSRWNPGYWIYGPEYTCLECPEGSEEAVLNEGTQATRDVRDDDPTIPAPPPGKKLVWPRTP